MPNRTVVLVHGTWPRGPIPSLRGLLPARARKPLWFEAGSDFRSDLSGRLGGQVRFEVFEWSGRNTLGARGRAARDLRALLAELSARSPGDPVVVVAHSHGGNVALAAIAGMPADARPSSVVTMATPFLSLRPRVLARWEEALRAATLGGTLMLMAGSALFLTGTVLDRALGDVLWGVALVGVMLLAYLALAGTTRAWREARAVVLDSIRRDSAENLDVLVLRAPGDEATLALSGARLFGHLGGLLRALLGIPLRTVAFAVERIPRAWRKPIFYLVFFGLLAISLWKPSGSLSSIDDPALFWAVAIVLLTFPVLVLATPLLLCLSAAAVVPFGYELLLFGSEIEVDAEAAPPGVRCTTEVISPKQIGAGQLPFRHGLYALPLTREKLAEWIARER